jgi:hypothetical protein
MADVFVSASEENPTERQTDRQHQAVQTYICLSVRPTRNVLVFQSPSKICLNWWFSLQPTWKNFHPVSDAMKSRRMLETYRRSCMSQIWDKDYLCTKLHGVIFTKRRFFTEIYHLISRNLLKSVQACLTATDIL